jgi:hypothetical protein
MELIVLEDFSDKKVARGRLPSVGALYTLLFLYQLFTAVSTLAYISSTIRNISSVLKQK